MPYKLLWVYWQAIRSAHAAEALNAARGIGLVFGGDQATVEHTRAIRDAFPAR